MSQFFRQVYLSCSDFSFYRTIVRQKLRPTIQYLLILLFFVALISSAVYYFYFKSGMNTLVTWSQKHLPEISIRDGVVTSPVEQPYTSFEEDFMFVLDTTGTVKYFEPQVVNGVLVMKDRIRIRRPGMETQDVDLKWVKELDLNVQIIETWKNKITPLIIPFVFVLSLTAEAVKCK